MSLRNRARQLQSATGLSYQQALDRLRRLGRRPAELARQTGWPLAICDRFLIDGHAPIEVIEPQREPTVVECMLQVLEKLHATSAAEKVLLWTDRGRILSVPKGRGWVVRMQQSASLHVEKIIAQDRADWSDVADDMAVHSAKLKGGLLSISFKRERTSRALIWLRANEAIAELEPLIARDRDEPGLLPPPGGGRPGGAPAETRVTREKELPAKKKKSG
jgi:hypothetical protein